MTIELYFVYNIAMTPPLRQRPNLSDDVAFDIRRRILSGELVAGEKLREESLAAELGVSRTPVREALAILGAEGAVRCLPRRGYIVRELSLREARGLYPIRALLDPEALRLSGIPSARRLGRLEAIIEGLSATDDVVEAIRLDEDWHRELWAECPNHVLKELIEQFFARTRRYEVASMSQSSTIQRTISMKSRIVGLLRAGDLAAACEELRASLTAGGEDVFRWLKRYLGAADRQEPRPLTTRSES